MPNVLTALTLVATGGLLLWFVAIAIDPTLPINPFPPLVDTTPSADGSQTMGQTAVPSPSPEQLPAPTRSVRPTPTPLRPATPAPTPVPGVSFSAVVEIVDGNGCGGPLMAGTVVDSLGEPVEGYPIHVWGTGIDDIVVSGSAVEYGLSGWQILVLSEEVVTGTYYVQLHEYNVYTGHPAVSWIIEIELPGCQDGMPLVRFEQLLESEGGSP